MHLFVLVMLAVPGLAASSGIALSPSALLVQAAPAEPRSYENLFNGINLIILIAVLVYLLRKPIRNFFTHRSAGIRKALEEGRQALAAAQSQLAAAEEKLKRLEQEIADLKDSAAREMSVESDRLRKAAEEEEKRILESARSMIQSATQAAKADLKAFTAKQASELAEGMLREQLNEAGQDRLVNRFLQGIRKN